ncbi:hypothetical protein GCM10025774_31320 [Microbacterium kyungheense]
MRQARPRRAASCDAGVGEGGTFAAPTSLFPDYGSAAPGDVPSAPRPAVVQVFRA